MPTSTPTEAIVVPVPRRAFLLSSVALLSGCSALEADPTPTERPDRDDDGVPDGPDDYPDDPRRALRSSSTEGTFKLAPGEFSAHQLQGAAADGGDYLAYDLTVRGDATVDVLVFERAVYDAYEKGARDVAVVEEYTRPDVADTSLVDELDDRELILALDNTDQLTPATEETVAVDFRMSVAEPSRDVIQTPTEQ